MIHKNGEGYPDPTAGKAIKEADKPPEKIVQFVKIIKTLAEILDLEIVDRIRIKDKKTKREYR